MLQSATPLKKSSPWPPNISDELVSCTAPARRHASFHRFWTSCFWQGAESLAPATQNIAKPHLNLRKCSEQVFSSTFWFGHDSGVQFFDISTSKSCCATIYFFTLLISKCASNCFEPKRRALFRYLTFQTLLRNDQYFAHLTSTCFAPQWRVLCRHLNFQKVVKQWLHNLMVSI